MNRGQPRALDDRDAPRAWAWGASRALDHFETGPAVVARRVGREGRSRWGRGLPTIEFPALETGLMEGDLAFRQHAGGHTGGPNWPTFLAFAGRYFGAPAAAARGSG